MGRRGLSGSSRSPLPVCGFTFDGVSCTAAGDHFCVQRADHVQAFFEEILVHTKGRFARRPFILTRWQREEIVRPLFGQVRWDGEWEMYVRVFRVAWIELARKNGKSELLAGIALYLLCADGEESAEIYGAARDRDQARKVFDVAMRMVQLSPVLSKRLTVKAHEKRIVDERTGSYYETIAADAAGNLGHNPHGIIFDEVLTQRDGSLWHALRTAMGTRAQAMMVAATTAGDDPASFAAVEHAECERIAEQPHRAKHRFVYCRNTPKKADPWDERNWRHANPALGEFLSIESLREEAAEAKLDPAKENAFRQYRLNQWVQQTTRWMPLHLWDRCGGLVVEEKLKGRRCVAGLDLASTTDLAAWVLLFPPDGAGRFEVLWRFWTPEAQVKFLSSHTGGQAAVWVKQGLLRATEGDWIDYEGGIHPQIEADKQAFRIVKVGYDQKEATATAQFMQRLGLEVEPVTQGYGLSSGLKEIMRQVKSEGLNHGGHPVARWNADSAEVRQDDLERIKLVKPVRGTSGKRIDGIAALGNAVHVWLDLDGSETSVYEERDLVVL
jgi:phage terminase large subunit-like protein